MQRCTLVRSNKRMKPLLRHLFGSKTKTSFRLDVWQAWLTLFFLCLQPSFHCMQYIWCPTTISFTCPNERHTQLIKWIISPHSVNWISYEHFTVKIISVTNRKDLVWSITYHESNTAESETTNGHTGPELNLIAPLPLEIYATDLMGT